MAPLCTYPRRLRVSPTPFFKAHHGTPFPLSTHSAWLFPKNLAAHIPGHRNPVSFRRPSRLKLSSSPRRTTRRPLSATLTSPWQNYLLLDQVVSFFLASFRRTLCFLPTLEKWMFLISLSPPPPFLFLICRAALPTLSRVFVILSIQHTNPFPCFPPTPSQLASF